MTEHTKIKLFLLRVLLRMDGLPMPDEALVEAGSAGLFPRPLKSDAQLAVRALAEDDFICGNKDDLTGAITWTLTNKGQHKAKQLA